jgi:hypothetical protein
MDCANSEVLGEVIEHLERRSEDQRVTMQAADEKARTSLYIMAFLFGAILFAWPEMKEIVIEKYLPRGTWALITMMAMSLVAVLACGLYALNALGSHYVMPGVDAGKIQDLIQRSDETTLKTIRQGRAENLLSAIKAAKTALESKRTKLNRVVKLRYFALALVLLTCILIAIVSLLCSKGQRGVGKTERKENSMAKDKGGQGDKNQAPTTPPSKPAPPPTINAPPETSFLAEGTEPRPNSVFLLRPPAPGKK